MSINHYASHRFGRDGHVEPEGPGVRFVDFVVTYVITPNEKPVFFLEIKPGHVNLVSTRIAADLVSLDEEFRVQGPADRWQSSF